jgi:hypothetical protein
LVDSARSVALPREPEEQSNRDAEPKGSQHKPSANIETDGPHHQETNRDKNSGKLRVHLHHPHNARVAIGIAVLHRVNYLTSTLESFWLGNERQATSIAGLGNAMTSQQLLSSAIVMFAMVVGVHAEVANPPSDSELSEIAARGRALSEYDAAAWHAGDAVMALKPSQDTLQRYVARKTDKGWIVAFGRFDAAKTKFLIVYEAIQQSAAPTEYQVTKHDPPLADIDVYFRAARAHELVTKAFLGDEKPQRPYNISVLPAASGDWYVYAIPAQTDLAVLPFGGDVRYTVSADGTSIIEKRQMHKIVLEERVGSSPFNFHTHILSDVPEDSDVFYALTRKAEKGELLVTKKFLPDQCGRLGQLLGTY